MPAYSDKEYDKYRQAVSSALIGITAPLVGSIPKIANALHKEDFENQINRVDFLDSNSDFAIADPALKNAYIKYGKYGLLTEFDDVFSKHIPIGQGHVPADISDAGKFLEQRLKDNRRSILTVTPEAVSKRFESGEVDAGVGGGSSATLWGNPYEPKYTYAQGNYGVKKVIGSNPSAQFSAVELPPEDKREYLRTTDVIEEGAGKRGWGQYNNVDEGDIHFGKEYRKAGGLTTANDIYTYLTNKGVKVPMPTGNPARDLFELTEVLSETVNKEPYDALESIASPAPTWGASQRELGQAPTLTSYDIDSKNILKSGIGSFFDKVDPKELESGNPHLIETRVPFSDNTRITLSKVLHNLDDGRSVKGLGNRLSRVGAGGLTATAFTSTEVADDIRKGDYVGALLKTGAAYGTGELVSSAVNQGVVELSKRGVTGAPKAAVGIGTVLAPLAGIEAIDTASTLATGRNSREILTEANNTGPAIAAMTAPMTMAPLGLAGGPSHMQGYQRNKLTAEQTRANQAAVASRPGLARKRGPKGALPELGISEWLGINGQELAPQPYARGAGLNHLNSKKFQKVMAVLNGKEGYMLQGDPSSFRMANWSPLDRRRYYGGGAVGDMD